jgi:shikimate dehydrogenase
VPNYKAELVGVFGHPVAENPTVVMHEAAYAELGLNWRYLTIEVMPQDLGAAMAGMRAMNFRGINLTIPHKVAVLQYLDEVRPAAALMGAVNTVINEGGRLIGENADGKGFMTALTGDAGVDPSGKRVVVLGAGGAARALTVELALAGASRIDIVNRGETRGRELVELLNSRTPTTSEFSPWPGGYRVPAGTDILVNATSIGLFPNVHDRPDIDFSSIAAGTVVCDVIHTPLTPFLEAAQKQGARTVDGLGMLVYQGAIGFRMWTGLDAPVKVMHDALARAFGLA